MKFDGNLWANWPLSFRLIRLTCCPFTIPRFSHLTDVHTGKIIFLHGASSSGKSTIAKLLQNTIDEPFWHVSIDHLRDSGVLPLDRIRSGEFDWKDLREAFFSGFHHSLSAYAKAGNNLIIEHIVDTKEWMSLLVELLSPFDVYFVGIHCPLDVLEHRERERKDRPVGDARRDFETIHRHATYDLELNSTLPPEENIASLIAAWKKRTSHSAFRRMAEEAKGLKAS
jgi:chloramphenicol 3-O phosphotransferase